MNKMASPNFFSNDDKKPNFPFDDKPIGEYEAEMDECPSGCGKPLSEHTRKERIKCALKRIEGVPHH